MNFIPVRREPPSRQPRESGWRLRLRPWMRWLAVGFLVAATVVAMVQWATEPEVPTSVVPLVAGLYVLMVFAAAAPR